MLNRLKARVSSVVGRVRGRRAAPAPTAPIPERAHASSAKASSYEPPA